MPRGRSSSNAGSRRNPSLNPNGRCRAFTATCNNYTQSDLVAFQHVVRTLAPEGCAVIGDEIAPETGTPHYQAFVWLGKGNAMTSSAFRQKIKDQWRDTKWYTRRAFDPSPYGSAIGYCCKGDGEDARYEQAKAEADDKSDEDGPGWSVFSCFDGEPASDWKCVWQWGSPPAQGKRSDVSALAAACTDTSRPLADALLENPDLQNVFMRMPQGAKALRTMAIMAAPRNLSEAPKVVVFHGPTGTGKSWHINDILQRLGRPYHVQSTGLSSGNTVWMDGYDNQSIVWFSEYRSGIPFSKMLEILDKYEVKVQVKGQITQLVADTFFFCSPVPPSEWYKTHLEKDDGDLGQLTRRITKIVAMDGFGGEDRSAECKKSVSEVYELFGLPDPYAPPPAPADAPASPGRSPSPRIPSPPPLVRQNAEPIEVDEDVEETYEDPFENEFEDFEADLDEICEAMA